jgi:hypothetical protein
MENWAEVFPEIETFDEDRIWFVFGLGSTAERLELIGLALRYCDEVYIRQGAGISDAWLVVLDGRPATGIHQIARNWIVSAGRFWGRPVSFWQQPS